MKETAPKGANIHRPTVPLNATKDRKGPQRQWESKPEHVPESSGLAPGVSADIESSWVGPQSLYLEHPQRYDVSSWQDSPR